MAKKSTRRRFLRWAATTSTGLALSACRIPATEMPPPSPLPTLTPAPTKTPAPTPTQTPTATPTPTPALQSNNTPQSRAPAIAIVQPAVPGREAFIQYAFEMRRIAIESGDQAYGAIVVKDNLVVGLGPSRVVINHDATSHAEMEAIRDASRRLGTSDLSGCVMYSSSRPCGMCEAAAYWARITRMFYGANASDAGAPRYCSCS